MENQLISKSTFLITSSKYSSFGTGFCIDNNDRGSFFVTCKHVIESCGEEYLKINNKKAIELKNIITDELIDMSVVYVEGLFVKSLKLSSFVIEKNDYFIIDGFKTHKSDYKLERLSGQIKKLSEIHTPSKSVTCYELTMDKDSIIKKGYSGSAIISQQSGQVIAIATDRVTTGKQAYAIPIQYLKDIWKDLDLKLFDSINPFVGLNSFTREDSAYFFGRDKEISEICKQVNDNSIVPVIGDSGSGKSSLVKAGVIPKCLIEYSNINFSVIETRPAKNPFSELALCISKVCDERNMSATDTGYFIKEIKSMNFEAIHSVFEQLFQDEKALLLLYIDQFEELFTLCSEELQGDFINLLLFLIENQTSKLTIKIIFTMRRDYVNLILDYKEFSKQTKKSIYLVRRMNEKNLIEVITKPLKLLDVSTDHISKLSSVILENMGDESKEITLLQIALTETWERKVEFNNDLLAAYIGIGKVTGALSHLATNTMNNLNDKEKEIFKYIFIRLIKFNTMGGITRRLADRSEFSDDAWALIQKLSSTYKDNSYEDTRFARLLKLRTDNNNFVNEEVVELIHEALTMQWDIYVKWIREVNEGNRKYTHDSLIEKSKDYRLVTSAKDKKKFALTGYALEESIKLLEGEYNKYLSEDEKYFIRISKKLAKSNKVLNRIGLWALFGIIMLYLISITDGNESKKEENNNKYLSNKLFHIKKESQQVYKLLKEYMNHDFNQNSNLVLENLIITNFSTSTNKDLLKLVSESYIHLGDIYYHKEEYLKALEAYNNSIRIEYNKYVFERTLNIKKLLKLI